MASLPRPGVQNSYTAAHQPKWSQAEKAIARKAFDKALHQELEEVIAEAKKRAGRIQEPAELWKLESYLTRRRQEIDRLYDYRYSVLPFVFASLIRKDRLGEEELHGLADDKLAEIRLYLRASKL